MRPVPGPFRLCKAPTTLRSRQLSMTCNTFVRLTLPFQAEQRWWSCCCPAMSSPVSRKGSSHQARLVTAEAVTAFTKPGAKIDRTQLSVQHIRRGCWLVFVV